MTELKWITPTNSAASIPEDVGVFLPPEGKNTPYTPAMRRYEAWGDVTVEDAHPEDMTGAEAAAEEPSANQALAAPADAGSSETGTSEAKTSGSGGIAARTIKPLRTTVASSEGSATPAPDTSGANKG